MQCRVILSRLLDKYESSKHLLLPGVSVRRVMLRIDHKELPEYKYDEGSSIRDDYNNAAIALEKDGILSIEWARPGRMAILVLNLPALDEAYRRCGRQHPREKAEAVIATIERALPDVSCDWIRCWKQELCAAARQAYKIPSYCRDGLSFLETLVTALRGYDRLHGSPISMRAFSIECFQDSKTFEHECRDEFLRIARKYHEALREICLQQEPSQREELAFLGIYPRPELYELSGNCRIDTAGGSLEIGAAGRSGLGLPSSMVDSILAFDLAGISRITFIENKTNYDEYLLSEQASEEVVLYHGGFLSPQKKKLYEKLAQALDDSVEVSFWADIDLGGFRMFADLHRIFPKLLPKRMGAEEVKKFHCAGKLRSQDYLAQLQICRKEDRYPLFSDAIDQILNYGVTIEQEVFLTQ